MPPFWRSGIPHALTFAPKLILMTFSVFAPENYMKIALQEAETAYEKGEIPVGAVVVSQRQVIAKGHNMTEQLQDVTAHAELIALTSASEALGSKYLTDCQLYVTLEPCAMCAGALGWAQLEHLVFGASDPKRGFTRLQPGVLHPKTQLTSGIAEEECREVLQAFFEARR